MVYAYLVPDPSIKKGELVTALGALYGSTPIYLDEGPNPIFNWNWY